MMVHSWLFLTTALLTIAVSHGYQATGFKIGELSDTEVSIWTRTTLYEDPLPYNARDAENYDSAPGSEGQTRVTLTLNGEITHTQGWTDTDSDADYIRKYVIGSLTPDSLYHIEVESRKADSSTILSSKVGSFRTAPSVEMVRPVTGVVVTCQEFESVDDELNGHKIYQEFAQTRPDFFVHTGDVIYYDAAKRYPTYKYADSLEMARLMWNKTFSMIWQRDFGQVVPAYYIKDDHDTYVNDCHPYTVAGNLGTFTFEQGVALFKEQTPTVDLPYRTFRWGKDLQIWLIECRDFRSNNNDADGPDKTILGAIQKQWLKDGVTASDATFKLVISPTPIVGPSGANKNDNHADAGFFTEGDELRRFLASIPNTYVVNGDRHWQYGSKHPDTGLREYGCGAVNAAHRRAGLYVEEYNTYYAKRGGYMSFETERVQNIPQITFRWHDIDDTDAETGLARVVYEETLRPVGNDVTTLTYDHIADEVSISRMSQEGKYYSLEESDNMGRWIGVESNATTRGQALNFHISQSGATKKFYRIVETDELYSSSSPLAPILTASQGTVVGTTPFNRKDFVMDLEFTMPAGDSATQTCILFEVGGNGRGTSVGLTDGKLTISAGRVGESIVNYTGATTLAAETTYSLRITANSEAVDGDSLVCSLWAEGQASAEEIIREEELILDGFSGSNAGGVGFVNSTYMNDSGTISTLEAPVGMDIHMSVYDPDEVTDYIFIPEQQQP